MVYETPFPRGERTPPLRLTRWRRVRIGSRIPERWKSNADDPGQIRSWNADDGYVRAPSRRSAIRSTSTIRVRAVAHAKRPVAVKRRGRPAARTDRKSVV